MGQGRSLADGKRRVILDAWRPQENGSRGMNLRRRQKVGVVMIGAAILAGVIVQVSTGKLVEIQAGPVVLDGSGTTGSASWTATYQEVEEQVEGKIFYPLLGCAVAGVVCLAWPGGGGRVGDRVFAAAEVGGEQNPNYKKRKENRRQRPGV